MRKILYNEGIQFWYQKLLLHAQFWEWKKWFMDFTGRKNTFASCKSSFWLIHTRKCPQIWHKTLAAQMESMFELNDLVTEVDWKLEHKMRIFSIRLSRSLFCGACQFYNVYWSTNARWMWLSMKHQCKPFSMLFMRRRRQSNAFRSTTQRLVHWISRRRSALRFEFYEIFHWFDWGFGILLE